MVVKSDKYGSVGNVEVTLKLPYVVERVYQPNKDKKS
jgi:hypothetical protein